jgi:cell division protease FtsH
LHGFGWTWRRADYEIQIVNALLAEIDGADHLEGVVLLGTCNHPEKLDPALVRSGRLDRQIRLGLSDVAALAAILREHLIRMWS